MNLLKEIQNYIWLIVFGCLGMVFIIDNWYILLRWIFTKKEASTIPLLGGFFLGTGLFFSPLRQYFWLCFIDPGLWSGIAGIFCILFCFIKDKKHAKSGTTSVSGEEDSKGHKENTSN